MRKVVLVAGLTAGLAAVAAPEWKLVYEKPGETNVIHSTGANPTAISVRLERTGDQWSGKIVNGEKGATVTALEVMSDPLQVNPEKDFLYLPWECGGVRVKVWPKPGVERKADAGDGYRKLMEKEFFKEYKGARNFWVDRGNGIYTVDDRMRYPGAWATMPWMACCDGKRGFYFGSHDPRYSCKDLLVRYDANAKTLRLGARLNLWLGDNAESVVSPLVFMNWRGTWHAAARRYREWWNRCFRFAYVPDRVKDMTGVMIVLLKQQNGEIIWPYTEFEALGKCAKSYGFEHVEFHAWGKGGHDQLYPEYDPDPLLGGREGLIAGVKKLREMGIHATLYSNGQLQEREVTKYWREKGYDGAIVTREGKPYTEFWHKFKNCPGHTFDVVCYWHNNWKDQMLKICRDAREYGFEGFFYDQIGVQRPRPCFAPNHGHRVGAYVYEQDRSRLFKDIADMIHSEDPEFVLASEGYNDSIFDSCAWYEGWCWGGYAWHRFEKDHAFDAYPEMTFCTFPEVVATDRSYTPTYDRREMNGAVIMNCRINFAVRYRIDRDFVECGKVPTAKDTEQMISPTDWKAMAKADWAANRAYAKLIGDWRRANRELLLRGTFRADEGFEVTAEGDTVANRWDSADGMTGIVVWNGEMTKAQNVRVDYPGEFVYAEDPEKGKVDAASAIPANTLRLYVFKTVR